MSNAKNNPLDTCNCEHWETCPVCAPNMYDFEGNRLPDMTTSNASKPTNPKDAIGIKKAPMSTVSALVLAEVGVAMLEGAAKYGRHNYRAVGVRSSVYYDATRRHLDKWWEGEDLDPDSSLSHITKAITSLVVLRDAMIQGKLEDDRPLQHVDVGNFYRRLDIMSEHILDSHKDKNPKHYTKGDKDV